MEYFNRNNYINTITNIIVFAICILLYIILYKNIIFTCHNDIECHIYNMIFGMIMLYAFTIIYLGIKEFINIIYEIVSYPFGIYNINEYLDSDIEDE